MRVPSPLLKLFTYKQSVKRSKYNSLKVSYWAHTLTKLWAREMNVNISSALPHRSVVQVAQPYRRNVHKTFCSETCCFDIVIPEIQSAHSWFVVCCHMSPVFNACYTGTMSHDREFEWFHIPGMLCRHKRRNETEWKQWWDMFFVFIYVSCIVD